MATDISALFPGLLDTQEKDTSDPENYFVRISANLDTLVPSTGDDLEKILSDDGDDDIPANIQLNIKRTSRNVANVIVGMQIKEAFENAGVADMVPAAFEGDEDALDACIQVLMDYMNAEDDLVAGLKESLHGEYLTSVSTEMDLSAEQTEKLKQHLHRFESEIIRHTARFVYAGAFDQDHKEASNTRMNKILQDGLNYVLKGFGPPPMPGS